MGRRLPDGERRSPIARNYPCVECATPNSALKRLTRCTDCATALRGRRAILRRKNELVRAAERERNRARNMAQSNKLASIRVEHGELSVYDEMTQRVELETGIQSAMWRMLDPRWDRVVYLAREALGIPHGFSRDNRGRPCKSLTEMAA